METALVAVRFKNTRAAAARVLERDWPVAQFVRANRRMSLEELNALLRDFRLSAQGGEYSPLSTYETKQLLDAGLIKSADPKVDAAMGAR